MARPRAGAALLAGGARAARPEGGRQRPLLRLLLVQHRRPGLPNNVVLAPVFQTHDGYLWVGTEGGLARFDGVRFTTFRRGLHPGLADNLIRCFYEDRDGVLWIGTQGGLSRYRGGKFERLPGITKAVSAIWRPTPSRPDLDPPPRGRGIWEYAHGSPHFPRARPGPARPTSGSPISGSIRPDRIWVGFRGRGVAVREHGAFHAVRRGWAPSCPR